MLLLDIVHERGETQGVDDEITRGVGSSFSVTMMGRVVFDDGGETNKMYSSISRDEQNICGCRVRLR